MKKLKYEDIKDKFTKNELNSEQTLEALSKIGYCPNLLNDDAGHWAISTMGMQNVPPENGTEDIMTTMFVQAKSWKNTIREALLFYFNEDD